MEVIYMLAFNLYNAAKFENAEKIFHLLSNLDHFERKYWKGLGACRQALQKYDEALLAYGYLGMMRPEDPDPAYQAAKCFVAVGKMAEAETALRGALFGSVNKPEYAEIHARATTLLEVVENNRKAKSAATSS
jgi:tetratricopeptide (TPR) repeat protein